MACKKAHTSNRIKWFFQFEEEWRTRRQTPKIGLTSWLPKVNVLRIYSAQVSKPIIISNAQIKVHSDTLLGINKFLNDSKWAHDQIGSGGAWESFSK